ncbi:hypothetical protein [Nocardia neocaledoniensis]|uniref:hypothetical protein n=1 Tax=Nocardia neocaledoniensis TaxID=236511 RepID=UPI0024543E06|nr:hypothetical protein [Nocardia neocaledoniensis]
MYVTIYGDFDIRSTFGHLFSETGCFCPVALEIEYYSEARKDRTHMPTSRIRNAPTQLYEIGQRGLTLRTQRPAPVGMSLHNPMCQFDREISRR